MRKVLIKNPFFAWITCLFMFTECSAWGADTAYYFSYPCGIAIDSMNSVYVTDYRRGTIKKFDLNGTYIMDFNIAAQGLSPWKLAIDSANKVYVIDRWPGYIWKFDSTGNFIAKWKVQPA